MTMCPIPPYPRERILGLVAELQQHTPQWADRLSQAKTEQDVREILLALFNLANSLPKDTTPPADDLAGRIASFVNNNLHKGLTLKDLSRFLGYSEKYCSDLFRATMGEPFSVYLKHRRVERASRLLHTTDQSLSDIAAALGFSDQFAFSHFFKRATGQSPAEFRNTRGRHAGTGTSRN